MPAQRPPAGQASPGKQGAPACSPATGAAATAAHAWCWSIAPGFPTATPLHPGRRQRHEKEAAANLGPNACPLPRRSRKRSTQQEESVVKLPASKHPPVKLGVQVNILQRGCRSEHKRCGGICGSQGQSAGLGEALRGARRRLAGSSSGCTRRRQCCRRVRHAAKRPSCSGKRAAAGDGAAAAPAPATRTCCALRIEFLRVNTLRVVAAGRGGTGHRQGRPVGPLSVVG